ELIDRLTVSLTGDIPERLLDRAERAEDRDPAAPEALAAHALPEVPDPGGVLAHDEALGIVDGRSDRSLLHLERALAPAVNSLVGLDLDKNVLAAGRLQNVGGDGDDFHCSSDGVTPRPRRSSRSSGPSAPPRACAGRLRSARCRGRAWSGAGRSRRRSRAARRAAPIATPGRA